MDLAFVDESGTPGPGDNTRYFVVAALVAATIRPIELHVRRARRVLHRRQPTSELKAAQSSTGIIRRMLQAIAAEPCVIYAVVVDKQGTRSGDSEVLYRYAVAQAIYLAVERHRHLQVTIDKRYSNARQRSALEHCIRELLQPLPGQLVIVKQVDSATDPGLQAVDFVAWALAARFERGEMWADMLAERIARVEVPQGKKIAALPGDR